MSRFQALDQALACGCNGECNGCRARDERDGVNPDAMSVPVSYGRFDNQDVSAEQAATMNGRRGAMGTPRENYWDSIVKDILKTPTPPGQVRKLDVLQSKDLVAANKRQSRVLAKAITADEKHPSLMDRHKAKAARQNWGQCVSRITQLVGSASKLFDLIDKVNVNAAKGEGTEVTVNEMEALLIFEDCAAAMEKRQWTDRVTSGAAGGGGMAALLTLAALV